VDLLSLAIYLLSFGPFLYFGLFALWLAFGLTSVCLSCVQDGRLVFGNDLSACLLSLLCVDISLGL